MALPRCLGLELFCLISVVCSCRVAVFFVYLHKSRHVGFRFPSKPCPIVCFISVFIFTRSSGGQKPEIRSILFAITFFSLDNKTFHI